MISLVPLSDLPEAAVEALLDRAFGTDRHERTAYKVRGSARPIAGLSFAAIEKGLLIGSIQCWPVALTADDGSVHPLIMVGPVAVEPARQQGGVGRLLVERMIAARTGDPAMMLIGDPEYYGRFFGFTAQATAGWRLPGPVERHRLLARGIGVPSMAGVLGGQLPEII